MASADELNLLSIRDEMDKLPSVATPGLMRTPSKAVSLAADSPSRRGMPTAGRRTTGRSGSHEVNVPSTPGSVRHMVSFEPDMRFHVHMRSMPNVSNFDKDLVLRLKHGMANTTREKLKCDLQLAWLAEGPLDPFPWDDFDSFRHRLRPLRPHGAAARQHLRPATSEPILGMRLGGSESGGSSRHLTSAPLRGLGGRR